MSRLNRLLVADENDRTPHERGRMAACHCLWWARSLVPTFVHEGCRVEADDHHLHRLSSQSGAILGRLAARERPLRFRRAQPLYMTDAWVASGVATLVHTSAWVKGARLLRCWSAFWWSAHVISGSRPGQPYSAPLLTAPQSRKFRRKVQLITRMPRGHRTSLQNADSNAERRHVSTIEDLGRM